LDKEPADSVDGVRDQANMPAEAEPERVRRDLSARRKQLVVKSRTNETVDACRSSHRRRLFWMDFGCQTREPPAFLE
jgi:hypothetical protein